MSQIEGFRVISCKRMEHKLYKELILNKSVLIIPLVIIVLEVSNP